MKITITNAYTWYNKGDSGILLATIDCLKNIYGNNLEINVLSFSPEEDKKRYCKDPVIKEVYSNILNPHPYKPGKIGKTIAVIKLFFKMLYIQFNMLCFKKKFLQKNKILNILNNSDMIIVCGGGFLGGKKFDSLMHLYQIYINTCLGKPVYIMGTSIEPIGRKIIKHYTDFVLNKVNYVFAREEITEKYLSNILPKEKYCLIPDIAFMLEYENKKYEFIENIKKEKRLAFGITVRNWNFPNSRNKKESKEKYINSVCAMMEYFIKNNNATFIFIPQVTVKTGDDTVIAKIIKEKLKLEYKDYFIIKTEDWSPSEIKSIISNLDFFVGTRMHSNIFATSTGVPTTAIAYEKKTNGIMKTVGLQDYIVEINTITSDELISKVKLMINNQNNIKKELNKKIILIKDEINNTIKNVIKSR